MDKENSLSIDNIWKWFEKEFGEEAMNRYHGYETERLIIETRKRTVQAIVEEIDKAIKYYSIQNALNESTFRNERIEGLKIAKNQAMSLWKP